MSLQQLGASDSVHRQSRGHLVVQQRLVRSFIRGVMAAVNGFLTRWLRPDLVPPAPFLQCDPRLTPDGSGVLSDPNQIDAEFRKAWLPYFCCSGQRETSLDEFALEVDEWLSLLPEVHLPRLTGQVLADVVLRKGVSAGSLDGWGWRELKALPVSWFDELARILTKVEIWVSGLMVCWMLILP